MTTQKQKVACLEAMGWTEIKIITPSQMYGKHPSPPPNTKVYLNGDYETPNFQSLDALFTHLIPWMREKGWGIQLDPFECGDFLVTIQKFRGGPERKSYRVICGILPNQIALAILECATKALGLWKE